MHPVDLGCVAYMCSRFTVGHYSTGDRAGLSDGPFPSRPIFIFPSASIMPAITLTRIEPPKPMGAGNGVGQ